MIAPEQYTGARVLRSTHDRIKTLSRQACAAADRDVSIREIYSAIAELAFARTDELNSIIKSGRFSDGE